MGQFGVNEEAYTYGTLTHHADAIICGDMPQSVSLVHLTDYRSCLDRTQSKSVWVVQRDAVSHGSCGLIDVEYVGFIGNDFFDHESEAKARFVELVTKALAGGL